MTYYWMLKCAGTHVCFLSKVQWFCVTALFAMFFIILTTQVMSRFVLHDSFQIRDQIIKLSIYLSILDHSDYICWVEFPFHVLLSSSSSSLLWSRWIPPSSFTDETPPGTLRRTPELPRKQQWHRLKRTLGGGRGEEWMSFRPRPQFYLFIYFFKHKHELISQNW